ncbi:MULTISPECIES: hemolysin family protein [Actinotignum]|uniref:hemolysin family protein n=1 Tax=Actinotignum TaxID=1653174 RepID=UPI00254C2F67|nr:hemolysin family protein [Actinotignum timonense]MDK6927388.1 hemolysin family protein [Actinotignum timonense]
MSNTLALILTVLLLAGNAYFVACEFALTASRPSRLEPLAESNPRAAKTLAASRNLNEMLAACQLGVTLCSVALGALAEPALAALLLVPLAAVGAGAVLAHTIAFVLALLLVTALHVILGEMVPKNLAVTHPERLGMLFVPSLLVFDRVFRPITGSLNWLAVHIVSWMGMKPKDEVISAFTASEVAAIVHASQAAGVLQDTQGLITGALEFSEHQVGDTMLPLDKVVTCPRTATPAQVERLVADHGYSRFPLVSDGNIVGYIHVKDILDAAQRELPISARLVRPVRSLDAGTSVEDALRTMQTSGTHMAIVEDNGKVTGVIFLEDVIEDLVGDVRDSMQRRS